MHTAPGGVTLDQLANALRERGFRRTPGSPRLITRLKRIRDIDVSRNGLIRVVGEAVEVTPHPRHVAAPAVEEADDGFSIDPDEDAGEEAAETEAGEAPLDTEPASGEGGQRRRRRRRGGRRRRGRRGNGSGAGGNGDTGGEVLAAAPSSDSFPEF